MVRPLRAKERKRIIGLSSHHYLPLNSFTITRKRSLHSSLLTICLLALAPTFVSCGDDNPTEGPNQTSIIGRWSLDKATQSANGNDVDISNFYGEHFFLTFLEDGTLITSDGNNEATMQWALDGENLDFIQAPGLTPVRYLITLLTNTKPTIVNGSGTDYVTTMEFSRV